MFKSRRDHNFRIFKELIKHNFIGSTRISNHIQFPYCLVVRIPGSHPGGPGSIPGMGKMNVLRYASSFCKNRKVCSKVTKEKDR